MCVDLCLPLSRLSVLCCFRVVLYVCRCGECYCVDVCVCFSCCCGFLCLCFAAAVCVCVCEEWLWCFGVTK